MYVGIDIGSTFTKYCVLDEFQQIKKLYSEKTPIRQNEKYFDEKIKELVGTKENINVVSCGYGRKNVSASRAVNEITALALGAGFVCPEEELVLDIGGQDTKLVRHSNGRVKEFFVNDKCAAGSGLFLSNICNILEKDLKSIYLSSSCEPKIKLSAVCAVFAQSEIVELLAQGVSEGTILHAVVWQIFVKAKVLLDKTLGADLLLSGGLTEIKGIKELAEAALNRRCVIDEKSKYLSAIGSALFACKGF